MKKIIDNYSFNPTERKITFNDYVSISLERVLLITNVTRGEIIYSFADPSKGGSVSGNVLTLNYDTTEMDDTDILQIWYEDVELPAMENGVLLLIKELLERIRSDTNVLTNLDVPISDLKSQNYEKISLLTTIRDIANNLDVPISNLASQNTLQEIQTNTEIIYKLLQILLQTPLGKLAIDSAGRLRIIIDAAGTATPVSQSGAWMMPTYSNGSIVFQLSNIEYNECQRSKFTF